MAGRDSDNGCWKRKGCLPVASHIYICLKPLINLPIMDRLRFLLRNALGLVLSFEWICKSGWAVWELTVAGLRAQLRPGFSFWEGPLFLIHKFLFHGQLSWCDVFDSYPQQTPSIPVLVYHTCPRCSGFSLSSKRLWPSERKDVFLCLGS